MDAGGSSIRYLSYKSRNGSLAPLVCYPTMLANHYGIWLGKNPFIYTIPLFLLQLILIIFVSRLLDLLLRPLRQPRYFSEVISGVLLGPSVLGRVPQFGFIVFPLRSLVLLDTMAQLGLIFFIFGVGVEVQKQIIRTQRAKTLAFAAACLVPSFTLGSLSGLAIHRLLREDTDPGAFVTFLIFVLSVNSAFALCAVLAELKLINSEIGRLALSSAMYSDACSWVLLALSIGISQSDGDPLSSFWTVLSGATFLLFSFAVLKPAVVWMQSAATVEDGVEETSTNVILVGVMVWAFIADAMGTHAIFGAFVFGFSVPPGPLAEALMEKVEDFVKGLLLPLVFLVSGLRTDVNCIKDVGGAAFLVVVMLGGSALNIATGACVAAAYKMPPDEGISLGVLMSTKGMIVIFGLNIGRSKQILGDQSFTILLFTSVLVTAMVRPLLKLVSRPSKRIVSYKRRTIWWPNPESELRLLICLHVPRQASGLIALLDICHPTKRSPIFVYALHLIELTARTSTLLLNSGAVSDVDYHQPPVHIQSRIQIQSDHIVRAFECYKQYAGGVSIQFLNAVSPYATMYEDVISAAEDRQAALILLPFHKHVAVDGGMRVDHPACRALNEKVLSSAPCSVGILIDRSLGGLRAARRITQLFFGGPDDREALALVSRMVVHPSVEVTVLHFVQAEKVHSSEGAPKGEKQPPEAVVAEDNTDARMDAGCLCEFRARWGGGIAECVKVEVNNAEETVEAIRRMDGRQDLYVVGRGRGKESPLTAGLTAWSECPEVGPIGDLLASPDFGSTASVLVLQHGGGEAGPAPAPAEMAVDRPVEVVFKKANYRDMV